MPDILLIEDDRSIAEALTHALQNSYQLDVANTGRDGLYKADINNYDFIILDLNLPDLPGHVICQQLRERGFKAPIVVLTADNQVLSKIKLLDGGANDYLTKPFSFVELLARLRAITRRGVGQRRSLLKVADLELDPATRRVHRGGREVHLTATEFRLLEFLMRRTGRAVMRDSIVETVWGSFESVEDNTLEAFISLLRTKIDKGFQHKLIHTIRGVGYSLREEV